MGDVGVWICQLLCTYACVLACMAGTKKGRGGVEKWERESFLSPIPPLLIPAYCVYE